jgi:hypothetical protein
VLEAVVILGIILISLFALSLWLTYREEQRARNRVIAAVESTSNRRFYKRIARDPEEQYIEGVGYIIGDISCQYNARSPYIRCAVNPGGLCQDCLHYSEREDRIADREEERY